LSHAIRLNPKDAVAYNNRGVAYIEKGELDKAIADYDKALELAPNSGSDRTMLLNNRGNASHEKGQFDRAIADYDEAIRLDPNDARFYVARADTRAKLGRIEEALSDVSKALKMDAPLSEQKHSLAWFLATCEDLRLRRVDRALELANQALKQAPRDAATWTTVGVAEYRAGHWQAAADALQKSSDLKYYRVARTGFFRVMAHWQLGQKGEARRWYDKAVEWMEKNRPQDKELRRFRAEAEELMGLVETHHGVTM
jgi:tetratricopeptide (TPR) repeat protein